jgi:hypothetical protein
VDEIATVIQAVPGVVAVNVKELHTVATSTGGDINAGVAAAPTNEVHTVINNAASFLSRFRNEKLTLDRFNRNLDLSVRQKVPLSLSQVVNWRSRVLLTPLPRPNPQSVTQIYPYLPVASPTSVPQPAEILVLDPNPGSVVLGVMS